MNKYWERGHLINYDKIFSPSNISAQTTIAEDSLSLVRLTSCPERRVAGEDKRFGAEPAFL
jgi:hypothetical protein